MNDRICFFVGAKTPFNVQLDLSNIGWMLSNNFYLDVVSTRGDLEQLSSEFEIHGQDHPSTIAGEATALYSYLQERTPGTVLQVTHPQRHGALVGTLSKYFDVPFVYRYSGDRFRNFSVRRWPKKGLTFGYNNLFGRIPLALADYYIAMGPTGRNRLISRDIAPDKVEILPPPVDPYRFRSVTPPDSLSIPTDRNIVLFIGRRTRLKGMKTLEDTIPTILQNRNNLHFLIVGPGDDRPRIDPPAADSVTIVGSVPPDKIPQYFAAADLLIHPSLIEGLPRVILEAKVAEIPVVARDVADVAYATENLFRTDNEFVEMVCRMEDLSIDDTISFDRRSLQPVYVDFFKRACRGELR